MTEPRQNDWRIGIFPDHGMPITALDDDEIRDLHTQLVTELRRRGDRPWVGATISHGVWIDVDGGHVVVGVDGQKRHIIFEEAMDVSDLLDRAIGQAVRNMVDSG